MSFLALLEKFVFWKSITDFLLRGVGYPLSGKITPSNFWRVPLSPTISWSLFYHHYSDINFYLIIIQLFNLYLITRQGTATQWGFSSTRLTRSATSTNWTRSTRALFILRQGLTKWLHSRLKPNDLRSGDKRTVELLVKYGAKARISRGFELLASLHQLDINGHHGHGHRPPTHTHTSPPPSPTWSMCTTTTARWTSRTSWVRRRSTWPWRMRKGRRGTRTPQSLCSFLSTGESDFEGMWSKMTKMLQPCRSWADWPPRPHCHNESCVWVNWSLTPAQQSFCNWNHL